MFVKRKTYAVHDCYVVKRLILSLVFGLFAWQMVMLVVSLYSDGDRSYESKVPKADGEHKGVLTRLLFTSGRGSGPLCIIAAENMFLARHHIVRPGVTDGLFSSRHPVFGSEG